MLDEEQIVTITALAYAREFLAWAPGHWLRNGILIALDRRLEQFPDKQRDVIRRVARRHVGRLLQEKSLGKLTARGPAPATELRRARTGERETMRTAQEVLAQQKRDHEKKPTPKGDGKVTPPPSAPAVSATVPALRPAPTAVVIPDARTPVAQYLDQIVPAEAVGSIIEFGKGGEFKNRDTDEVIPDDQDFIVLADETQVGYIRFHHDGETPPDRICGLLYDGFIPPPRSTLGDTDPALWEDGLSGKPEDPWKLQFSLVLQRPGTMELFTFRTMSITGVKSVGRLLKHYDRMRRKDDDHYPVVRLKVGGFQHRDERVGWVPVPNFAIVGKAPKASAAIPDTSVSADLNDSVPF